MTGREYASGAARRHNRRTADRRTSWQSARDGFGAVGSAAGLIGVASLAWAAPAYAYVALGLILLAGGLSAAAMYCQHRARKLLQPQPSAFASRPAHGQYGRRLNEQAETVWITPRRQV